MKLKKFLTLFPFLMLFVSILGTSASFAVAPEDFVNPPSNYEPMNIYIKEYNYMGYIPLKDDKIGVFNEKANGDTLCVGVITMKKDFTEFGPNEYIKIIAYKEYRENGVVLDDGFTENDTLKFYQLVSETNQVVAIPQANVTNLNKLTGEPIEEPALFFGRSTVVVEIHSGEAKLTIDVSPADVGETIPKSDEYLYSVSDGEVVTIQIDSAATQEHYRLSHWTVDGDSVATEKVQITMNENHQVTANFVLKRYTLTATPQPAVGEVIPSNPVVYNALVWADIFAKPATGSGYIFSHWEATPTSAEIEDSIQAGTRVKMTANTQMKAIFVLKQDSLFIQTDPAESGSTNPVADQWHIYSHGTQVQLKATPASGYEFKHWAEHVSSPKDTTIVLSTTTPYNIQIDRKREIYAVFARKQVSLQLQADQNMGDIYIQMPGDSDSTKATPPYSMDQGTQVTLYAVSLDANKYPFSNWSGDIDTSENPVTVTLDSSMTIFANFFDTTPVELASFSVQYAPNSVSAALLLKWQTASETNNLGFNVERSIGDDVSWEKIGFIEGYGTTTEAKFYEFIDEDATTEGRYYYRLKQIDTNGAFEYSNTVEFTVSPPEEFALLQNYPNPFNPSTQIVFKLKEDIQVNLTVYDLLGREVVTLVDHEMKAGIHKIQFDAKDVSAGLYFYSLKAGSFHEMKKMTLIK
ncbi:T9SS type A sorting domain-containing protein [candidate division KSB1 bacterium]|nr:T9SS type A sorting domain-containing protein [candidate division KSB1 bacterium]